MVGQGRKGDSMFHYVKDRDFLSRMKSDAADTVNRLVQRINNDGFMTVRSELVGSGRRKLITQNASEPVDIDYNLVIERCDHNKFGLYDGKKIKEYVKSVFDSVLQDKKEEPSDDSTSCLSSKKYCYKDCKNKTKFGIDLAILKEDIFGNLHRLIHQKTGFVSYDQWFWNQIPNSREVFSRAEAIRQKGLWSEVERAYLDKKNMYLARNDYNHPSFVCFIEAVNEVDYSLKCRIIC